VSTREDAQTRMQKSTDTLAATNAHEGTSTTADSSNVATKEPGENQLEQKYSDKVFVYDSTKNKETWWLRKIKKTTKVVLIGDSNLRNVTNIPPDWEVHGFPGAKMSHITGLLRQYEDEHQAAGEIGSCFRTLVLSIGINDRRAPNLIVEQHLDDLLRVATLVAERVIFQSLDGAKELSAWELGRVSLINDLLSKSKMAFLTAPHIDNFKTIHDNIHWTKVTSSNFVQGIINITKN
jgi:hypothetical protein